MRPLSLLLLIGALAGFASIVQATDLVVDDPYARAVPPGQPNSAVFMSLRNSGPEERAIVSAESPVAEVVELHTHVEEGGMMRMRRIERIALPVGESVQLQPGGLHVMLIGLKRDLHPGDLIDLTLVRDDGERIAIQAPVRKIEPRPMSAH